MGQMVLAKVILSMPWNLCAIWSARVSIISRGRHFQAPHKLNSPNVPSKYDIQFVKADIRYAYGFSIVRNAVEEEYLYYFPKGRQVKIFERENMDIKPGDKYKNAFEVSKSILKENRLFLSCAANYTNIREIENAFLFFGKIS